MAIFDFSSLKKAISGLSSTASQLDAAIASKETELQALRAAPLPRGDVIGYLHGRIDEMADGFQPMLAQVVGRLNRRPGDLTGHDSLGILSATAGANPASPRSMEFALCALLGPLLKKSIAEYIALADWPESGPPAADRQRLIAAAERELADLTAQRAELREHAAKSGVLI